MEKDEFNNDEFFAPYNNQPGDRYKYYVSGFTPGALKKAGIKNISDLAKLPFNIEIEGMGKNGWREIALQFARII